jgi:glycolate oxidase
LAARHAVPIVPRGAGSGLSGGATAVDGALTLVTTKMDRILEIDTGNLVAVVQPGVINAHLKAAVAAEGLFYPPDPASYEICSIGGNLGTNAGGLCCVKYGQTRDSVLGLEVVLADGRVIRTGGRNVKDVAGYALTHLFVGSQGTLGIITEATLRLHVAPPPRSTLLAFFPSLAAAGHGVAAIVAGGLHPVTLELLDHETILAVDDAFQLGLDREAAAMLLVESDLAPAAAAAELDAAVAACEAAGATNLVRAEDPTEADWLRQARRLALRALERQGTVRMEDVGVPRGRVPELLVEIEAVGYVGSKTSHIDNTVPNFNQPDPSPNTDINGRRPWQAYISQDEVSSVPLSKRSCVTGCKPSNFFSVCAATLSGNANKLRIAYGNHFRRDCCILLLSLEGDCSRLPRKAVEVLATN